MTEISRPCTCKKIYTIKFDATVKGFTRAMRKGEKELDELIAECTHGKPEQED